MAELDLAALPDRLDDATLADLRAIAAAPPPAPQRSTDEHFSSCMKALDILPRRAADEMGGKLQYKLYRRMLGGYSDGALSYLVEAALARCAWFPTIAECMDLLRAFPNAEVHAARRDKAIGLHQREMQHRQDAIIARLERRELSDTQIASLPEHIQRIGWTKGLLWKFKDGTFTVRPDPGRLSPDELQEVRDWVAVNSDRLVLG